MTVGELCAVCRNWFVKESVRGRFSVCGGVLGEVPGAEPGQYIRVIGSTGSDGVYRYPAVGLRDEVFEGAVWLMAPPPGFVALAREIDAWEKAARGSLEKAVENAGSGFRSESFGGYEYVRGDAGDAPFDWRDERLGFSARLRAYRKV
ncbi:MAG: hypothetical protein E7576_10835 [Ruminococcaceae bacterium]|nr:hypothetical protein [Oscillospiraceae bacterium]